MLDFVSLLQWAQAGLFGWVVPWWLWVVAGGALAVVVAVMVPGRLGMGLAILPLIIGGDIGFYSLGNANGIALERQTWERREAATVNRLREEAQVSLTFEQSRREAAEASSRELSQKLDEVLSALPTDDGTIVVPEHIARQLWNLRGHR